MKQKTITSTKHIGIVACSVPGAALCYETINLEGEKYLGKHLYPEVSMHNHPLGDYMKFIEKGDQRGVARLMLSSAEKLKACGADFLICPDNTVHEAFDLVEPKSPLPWLHIAHVVAENAERWEFKNCAVLGTKYLMEGPVYPNALHKKRINCTVPELNDRGIINDIIFDELVKGIIEDVSIGFFLRVIFQMKEKGCDAVVLGCTEIPLIINSDNSPLPVLDSTRLLAKAAVQKAVTGVVESSS